jgi:hypothetical protein
MQIVGEIRDKDGYVMVARNDAGSVAIRIANKDGGRILFGFDAPRFAQFRELLDRAAMPGQPDPLPRAATCPRCGLPDGTPPVAKACQHTWHQHRPQAAVEPAHPAQHPCCKHCEEGPDGTPCGISHDDPCEECQDAAVPGE